MRLRIVEVGGQFTGTESKTGKFYIKILRIILFVYINSRRRRNQVSKLHFTKINSAVGAGTAQAAGADGLGLRWGRWLVPSAVGPAVGAAVGAAVVTFTG